MAPADLHFYFDPICPFAWMTSGWVRQVMAARDYRVEWRFISLWLVNAGIDYSAHFPPEYEFTHTTGLRLLRVAAAARAEHGPDAVDRLQQSFGNHIF
ncbi:MAG TPA: DsbA family protein, partial [Acidimicrobiia bacterium]|nr:DsbA family protein [Acidimicrobiia bacterium]